MLYDPLVMHRRSYTLNATLYPVPLGDYTLAVLGLFPATRAGG
jgi:hypothetical protein